MPSSIEVAGQKIAHEAGEPLGQRPVIGLVGRRRRVDVPRAALRAGHLPLPDVHGQQIVLPAVHCAKQTLKRHDLLGRVDAAAFILRVARRAVVVLIALLGEHDRLSLAGRERQNLVVQPLVPFVGHQLDEVFVRIGLKRDPIRWSGSGTGCSRSGSTNRCRCS